MVPMVEMAVMAVENLMTMALIVQLQDTMHVVFVTNQYMMQQVAQVAQPEADRAVEYILKAAEQQRSPERSQLWAGQVALQAIHQAPLAYAMIIHEAAAAVVAAE